MTTTMKTMDKTPTRDKYGEFSVVKRNLEYGDVEGGVGEGVDSGEFDRSPTLSQSRSLERIFPLKNPRFSCLKGMISRIMSS